MTTQKKHTYNKQSRSTARGMSLVEVLISLSVMSIVSMVFGQMMVNQQKSLKYIEQKSDVQATQNTLLGLAKESQLCACQFAGLNFDSRPGSQQTTLELGDVQLGCQNNSAAIVRNNMVMSSGVKIDSVKFDQLSALDRPNNIWRGRWNISFAPENSVIQMKPIVFNQIVHINTDNGAASAFIDRCLSVSLDASMSCEMFGEGWVWDAANNTCIAPRNPAQEDCERLGSGWTWSNGTCSPPQNDAPNTTTECIAHYGTGWSWNGSACIPPSKTAEQTCLSLGEGWTWDRRNSRCVPPTVAAPSTPAPLPTNTRECIATYGTGWSWNGTTCVPPGMRVSRQFTNNNANTTLALGVHNVCFLLQAYGSDNDDIDGFGCSITGNPGENWSLINFGQDFEAVRCQARCLD